jgi:hypothetical protein
MEFLQLTKHYTEPTIPYNILSVCIFQMKKSYKSSYTYISGLKYTLDHLSKNLPGFFLRVYYDHSIEKNKQWMSVLNKLKLHKKVQLVKFHHKWFIDSDGYHLGTFGTIVRLVPLFEKEQNLKMVLIGDVDYNEYMLPYWNKTYKSFRNSQSQVHMFERNCNHLSERVKKIVSLYKLPFSPFLNSFWSKVTFPKDMLDNFLTCIYNVEIQHNDVRCEDIKLFTNNTDYSKVKKAIKMEQQQFMYGIDEICLLRLLKYVIDKKVQYSYHSFPDLLLPFKEIYTIDSELVNTTKHTQLIKDIMGKYYNKDLLPLKNFNTLYTVLNNFSTYLAPLKKEEDMIAYLTHRIKSVYTQLLQKDIYKQYNLDFDSLRCVSGNNLSSLELTIKNK